MTVSDFDPAVLQRCFNVAPIRFRHRLCDHPLLQTDALFALLRRLPPAQVELNAADVNVGELATVKPSGGLTPEETLQHIEHCKSWLGLKQLASVPSYRALLEQILGELRPAIDRIEPGMFGRQGYLFISSPRAVVPYHLDPEHNFLFQLRGRKRVTVFDKADRTIVTEGDLERHYATGNRRLLCPSEYDVRARVFELAPGDVLHVPISAPHHVRNRDEVNVSLSVTFRTPAGDRRENLYVVNHALRRLGLSPTPVGANPKIDALKLGMYQAGRTLRRLGG